MIFTYRLILVAALLAAFGRPAVTLAADAMAPATVSVTSGDGLPPLEKSLCPVLPPFASGVPLPAVRGALRTGSRLDILVVGSGTVLGPENDSLPVSFPYQMARELKEAVPGATITLTVRGGKGLTASEMLPIITAELAKAHYQLVIWQTGTVEAVKGMPVKALSATLAAGIAQVSAAGSDLLLVDSQYSRFLTNTLNLDAYQNAMAQAAASPGVSLFRRFDLMRTWVKEGGIDLEHAAPHDRLKTAETLHACLGRALGSLVLNEAGRETAQQAATKP